MLQIKSPENSLNSFNLLLLSYRRLTQSEASTIDLNDYRHNGSPFRRKLLEALGYFRTDIKACVAVCHEVLNDASINVFKAVSFMKMLIYCYQYLNEPELFCLAYEEYLKFVVEINGELCHYLEHRQILYVERTKFGLIDKEQALAGILTVRHRLMLVTSMDDREWHNSSLSLGSVLSSISLWSEARKYF
jgi:hypothetical protein